MIDWMLVIVIIIQFVTIKRYIWNVLRPNSSIWIPYRLKHGRIKVIPVVIASLWVTLEIISINKIEWNRVLYVSTICEYCINVCLPFFHNTRMSRRLFSNIFKWNGISVYSRYWFLVGYFSTFMTLMMQHHPI